MTEQEKEAESRTYIHWTLATLLLTLLALVLAAAFIVTVDPFFHYHAPLEQLAYPITNERYQNDGIIRHFEYDSIITGTSMTENFKTSEANRLFDGNFIKTSFAGSYYKEVNDHLQRIYHYGKSVKQVIRCLDSDRWVQDKDAYREEYYYPTYLYNDNPFDDVQYVFNKSAILWSWNVLSFTRSGNQTTSFDDYANWNGNHTFGADTVFKTYKLKPPAKNTQPLSTEQTIQLLENIRQNVTDLADEHPETTFYLFMPPYSITYWEVQKNDGMVDWHIDAEKLAIEEILKHKNIKLYSFCDRFDMVCDLDNYKDPRHYGEWVNSWILEWMRNEEGLLTIDNYQAYIAAVRNFYNHYDYALLKK